jgi:SAM-dependent methyltransferase
MTELSYADYCWDHGAFRQRDLKPSVAYDRDYLATYQEIDGRVRRLAAKRLAVLEAFVAREGRLLDFGCGTGRFVEAARRAGWDAWGYDVAPGEMCYADPTQPIWDVLTCFDSLEHVPSPSVLIKQTGAKHVMISVPECHYPDRPEWFMRWKHRKPGEHLWHWNRVSLDGFMKRLGYAPLMHSPFEDDYRPRYDPALPNILTAIYRRGGSC